MPKSEPEELTVQQAWAEMLKEQRQQTVLLKRINTVMQLFGALLILGIAGACLYLLLGTGL